MLRPEGCKIAPLAMFFVFLPRFRSQECAAEPMCASLGAKTALSIDHLVSRRLRGPLMPKDGPKHAADETGKENSFRCKIPSPIPRLSGGENRKMRERPCLLLKNVLRSSRPRWGILAEAATALLATLSGSLAPSQAKPQAKSSPKPSQDSSQPSPRPGQAPSQAKLRSAQPRDLYHIGPSVLSLEP